MRALELFCCSGGMAAGFRDAGIEFLFAFDADPNACASYEANLGHRPIRMDVRDLLRMVRDGWSPGPLDLIVADPPCTPWSRAGKRKGLEDDRDLLAETCELIKLLRPRAYLIGNVPGLQDGNHLLALRRTIGALGREGYCVGDFAQLDAASFGVPQRRIRPFWYGHRIGMPCISWPVPTHGDPRGAASLPGVEPLKPWVTCREALGHLPPADLGRPVRLRWKSYDPAKGAHKPSDPEAPARTVTRNANGDGTLLAHPAHPAANPDSPAPTLGAKSRRQGAEILAHPRHPHSNADAPARTVTAGGTGGSKRTLRVRTPQSERVGEASAPAKTLDGRPGRVGQGDNHVLAWPWDRPSTVVYERDVILPPGHHQEGSRQMPNAIVLSERAAAILQGFPEGWTFAGKIKAARWSQLGQAMPIGLAKAVALSVRRAMEDRCDIAS